MTDEVRSKTHRFACLEGDAIDELIGLLMQHKSGEPLELSGLQKKLLAVALSQLRFGVDNFLDLQRLGLQVRQ